MKKLIVKIVILLFLYFICNCVINLSCHKFFHYIVYHMNENEKKMYASEYYIGIIPIIALFQPHVILLYMLKPFEKRKYKLLFLSFSLLLIVITLAVWFIKFKSV